MEFDWNDEKNQLLKEERNVCFEDVVVSIQSNRLFDVVKNRSKNHQDQYCLIVEISSYAYVVPFVINDEKQLFLKTIYPSRKMTKKYLKDNS
jgi:uncharacterized DUF497 family protein